MSQKLDGVFEGGGVKGIALIGAASVVEEHGYVWENLAGTSAGAIVATLLAAGYSAADLHPILNNIDFKKFEDTSMIGGVPVFGPQYEIFRHLGLYRGDYFLNLMRDLLAAKGKRTFRDLIVPDVTDPRYRFKVQVIASDISRGQMLILPGDIRAYGIEPEDLEIALAVRMSMSIPYFFQPIPLKTTLGETCYIVDGGLLSNFPIELFDVPGVPEWPTFGFCLVPPQTTPTPTSASSTPSTVRSRCSGPCSTQRWSPTTPTTTNSPRSPRERSRSIIWASRRSLSISRKPRKTPCMPPAAQGPRRSSTIGTSTPTSPSSAPASNPKPSDRPPWRNRRPSCLAVGDRGWGLGDGDNPLGYQISISFAVYASAMMNLNRASGSLPMRSATVVSV
jgi:NTE family protein